MDYFIAFVAWIVGGLVLGRFFGFIARRYAGLDD